MAIPGEPSGSIPRSPSLVANKRRKAFAAYPVHGLTNIAATGFRFHFADGRHAFSLVAAFGGGSSNDSNLRIGR
jgi:hypothetical protein